MDIRKKLRCPECGKSYEANLAADAVACEYCQHRLPRVDQVQALLEEWYYPRRWYKAVERPRARFIIERLWQQQFEPRKFFEDLGPKDTSFDVFCFTVTQVVARGIEAGWAALDLPENPLGDDPVYKLRFLDLERFTAEMEQAFPDVKWDEEIEVPSPETVPAADGEPAEQAAEKKEGG